MGACAQVHTRRCSECAVRAVRPDVMPLAAAPPLARVPCSMVLCHLPAGPSMAFKFSSSMLCSDIKGHGAMTTHLPEVFLNGFSTRLGRRVGRLFASMFPKVRARRSGSVGSAIERTALRC